MDVINNDLIGALYPSDAKQIIPSWHALLQGDGGGLDAVFVHFIIAVLYIGLPMLFLILASWAGLKISSAVSSVMGSMQAPASDAGQAAGAIAKDAIIKAIRVASRGK